MSCKRLALKAVGVLLIACALPLTMAAQTSDTDKKLLELEKQLDAIKAQIEELKAASHPSAAPSPAPATTAVATPAPAAAAPAPAAAPAKDPLAGITSVLGGVNLTGVVDAYYGYNANHPNLVDNGGTSNEPFTFVNNQFSLNLLELQLDKPVDKDSRLGFRTAFFWGQAANAVNNAGSSYFTPDYASKTNGASQYLKEAYLSYFAPIGKGLQLDVGKWVTPAGVEVIESNQNNNYSRGLLFTYAIPYYHLGARAKYVFNDKWTVTGFMTNGWNNVIASNSGKTGGVSIAYSPNKKLTITENYLGGPRDFFGTGNNSAWSNLFDTIVTYSPTAKLSLAAQADYNRIEEFWKSTGGYGNYTNKPADYTGIGLFAKYQYSPKVAYSARYEFLNDHDGFATPVSYYGIANGQHMNEFTATAERKFAGHLISRLEYRHDDSNQDFFARGNVFGAVKGQTTVDVGLIFVLEPNN